MKTKQFSTTVNDTLYYASDIKKVKKYLENTDLSDAVLFEDEDNINLPARAVKVARGVYVAEEGDYNA